MKFLLGLASWATDSRDKYDGNQTDKVSTTLLPSFFCIYPHIYVLTLIYICVYICVCIYTILYVTYALLAATLA